MEKNKYQVLLDDLSEAQRHGYLSADEAKDIAKHLVLASVCERFEEFLERRVPRPKVGERLSPTVGGFFERENGQQPPAPAEKTGGTVGAAAPVPTRRRGTKHVRTHSTYVGPRSVIAVDLRTKDVQVFETVSVAAKHYGVQAARISEACSQAERTLGGRVWRYVPKAAA